MNDSKVPILLKNSIKMDDCFSAEKQSIPNFFQTPHRLSHPIPRQFIENGAISFFDVSYSHAYLT